MSSRSSTSTTDACTPGTLRACTSPATKSSCRLLPRRPSTWRRTSRRSDDSCQDRLAPATDGDRLDLGKHTLTFFDSPGHAPHELTILDEHNRCVYTGDATGLYFPGDEILMPVTPAPAFDLEKNLETFRRLLALKPRALLFSHYGPHTKPKAAIEAMMTAYPAWARVVRNKLTSIGEEGVLRELYDMSCRAAKRYPREFLERRIRVSITGLAAYHERMEHAARTG